MKVFDKRTVVWAAEKAGWLTFVDARIVAAYLRAEHTAAVLPKKRPFTQFVLACVVSLLVCAIIYVKYSFSPELLKLPSSQLSSSGPVATYSRVHPQLNDPSNPIVPNSPPKIASRQLKTRPRRSFVPPPVHVAENPLPFIKMTPPPDISGVLPNVSEPSILTLITPLPTIPPLSGQKIDVANNKSDRDAHDMNDLRDVVANLDAYKPVRDVAIPFGFDKDILTPEAKQQLDDLVADTSVLKQYFIAVEGFTDKDGTPEYNAALSRRRADRVMQYLVAQHDIPIYRIHLIGLGSQKPVTDSSSRAANAKNRRIEVTIYSTGEPRALGPLAAIAPPPSANENGEARLRIIVLDGDGTMSNIRQRIAREVIVRVEDSDDRPVAAARVEFERPDGKSVVTQTNENGLAVATLMPPHHHGVFAIAITASAPGLGTATIQVESGGRRPGAAAGSAGSGGAGLSGASIGAIVGGALVTVVVILIHIFH